MSNYNTQLQNNNTDLQEVLQLLQTKTAGTVLPSLSNPASEDEIFLNKEAIDKDGKKLVGQFTIDDEISTITTLIPQLRETVEGLPDAESGGGSSGGESSSGGTWSLSWTNSSEHVYVSHYAYTSNGIIYSLNGEAQDTTITNIPVGGLVYLCITTPYYPNLTFSENIINANENNKFFFLTCNVPNTEETIILGYEK